MPHLLQSNWKKLLRHVKQAGEEKALTDKNSVEDLKFLQEIGIFEEGESGQLTNAGEMLFESVFIRCDGEERNILRELLLQHHPTLVVQQYFWGRPAGVEQVLVALKARGFWTYPSIEPLTHFLDLLNYARVISYNKRDKKIKVLISPDTQSVPNSVFIDSQRPFSNIVWIKRVLAECTNFIYWFDKHFQKEGLEWLWSVADADKISEIKILSLDMGEVNLNKEAKKTYEKFKAELSNKGIKVTWATIDSKLVRDSHDRWIIGGKKYLRNTPNVNAIASGQNSEINKSDNYEEILKIFDQYWEKGKEVL